MGQVIHGTVFLLPSLRSVVRYSPQRAPNFTVVEIDALPGGALPAFGAPTPELREECPVTGLLEAFIPRKDESHGSTEEVPGRVA
jgi:hypothetical protein